MNNLKNPFINGPSAQNGPINHYNWPLIWFNYFRTNGILTYKAQYSQNYMCFPRDWT